MCSPWAVMMSWYMNPQHYPENGGLWGFTPEYLPRKAPVEQDPESHLQKHCEKVPWTLLWAGWIQRELQEILWCVVQEFKALNPWRPLTISASPESSRSSPRNVRTYTHELSPTWLPKHALNKSRSNRHANVKRACLQGPNPKKRTTGN